MEVDLADLWRAEVGPGALRGCALDITLETGLLYDPFSPIRVGWLHSNTWLRLKTRWFDVALPPLGELPAGPEEALDRLARAALAVADDEIEGDPRLVPPEEHARPYHDLPGLCHGRTFFDLRGRLARALYLQDGYREWVLARLSEEAERDLADLETRFRLLAPRATDSEIERALAESEDARRILRRAEAPSEADLSRFLSAWLGDVSAHDLLRDWERLHVNRLLRSEAADLGGASFPEAWHELRRLLFVPSYTRVLTLLSPVHAPDSDRIGFWRVVLPRPAWITQRLRGDPVDYPWGGLPFDLLPERPLAYLAIERLLERAPEAAALVRDRDLRLASIDSEPLGPAGKQNPRRAFDQVQVRLRLEAGPSGAPGAYLDVVADLLLDRGAGRYVVRTLQATAPEDPDLQAAIARAGPIADGPLSSAKRKRPRRDNEPGRPEGR
jgi:hypothetical protein